MFHLELLSSWTFSIIQYSRKQRHIWLILTLFEIVPMFTELLHNWGSATFIGNTVDTLNHLLQISFRRCYEWIPKSVFSLEDCPDTTRISIPYTFELLWNTLHIWDIHRAQRLFLFIQIIAAIAINNQVNETLGPAKEIL